MLKDITLGQYYQTESIIHRLDPRVKLTATIIYIISLFVVRNFWGYIIAALFLALSLPECKVYTTPCVGNSEYLKKQMSALHPLPQNLIILEPKKKYHFAKPYREFLEIQQKILSAGIEFDLIYAPSMWMALLEQTQEEILYIHSGGVSGNESMLARYRQKGFL